MNKITKTNNSSSNPYNNIQTIRDMIEHLDKKKGDFTAYTVPHKDKIDKITYRELKNTIQNLANALIQMGVQKGDKVALFSENRIEWVITYLAVASTGGVMVPLDILLETNKFSSVINSSDATFLCLSGLHINKILPIRNEFKNLKKIISFDFHNAIIDEINKNIQPEQEKVTEENFSYYIKQIENNESKKEVPFEKYEILYFESIVRTGENLYKNNIDNFSKCNPGPNDPVAMIYTTETTFAVLSNNNQVSNAFAYIEAVRAQGNFLNKRENWLQVLPYNHTVSILLGILVPIITYANTIISSDLKINDLIENIQKFKINYISLVPLLLKRMYLHIIENQITFNHLRLITTGAAPCDPNILESLDSIGIPYIHSLGLTECSPVVTIDLLNNKHYGSVGFPINGVTVKIDNPDKNGNGEILVKGPNIMLGYYKDPEKTKESINEGGFFSYRRYRTL
jgi:long-chain acyl-CoA synthetase